MSQTLLDEIFNYCLFSHSVVFNSLWPHWLQHTTLCHPSPSPGDCSNACPLVNDAIQPFYPLGLLLPLAMIFPSIRVFSNESAVCIRWPKYCSFIISPSNEYPGWISFRIDWFDLLAVQGTLKSLLQHHNSKASIFGAQPSLLSNSHIHTWLLEITLLWLYGPLLAVMPLLFNTLFWFFIAFLPRRNHLLISWLQSLLAVILEPKKIKSVSVSTFSPFICHEVIA